MAAIFWRPGADTDLPPALDRLADTIDHAIEESLDDHQCRRSREMGTSAAAHDYSI